VRDTSFDGAIRPEARAAPESGIVEVFNYGRTRKGLIPLWVGEGDLPTPQVVRDAARLSLERGETFYTYQRGLPELREAIARYLADLYGRPFASDEVFVTGSGMHAIVLAVQLTAGAGDEVLIPTPAWPNISGALGVAGARPVSLPMRFGNEGWQLDLDELFAAVTPRTRAVFINTPANPTGWTMPLDDMRALLAFARRRGLWIIADEIYTRFYYGEGGRAPSFFDVAEPEDRILYVNSFSKNWAMTGWRAGWLVAPPALGQVIENLVQYSLSGVPVFVQRGAIAALEGGEAFAAAGIERAARGLDIVASALEGTGRARFVRPGGAFYLFFGVEGEADARKLAFRLVDEANVGLAPGSAFGPGGESFLRLCFARSPDSLAVAAERLAGALRA